MGKRYKPEIKQSETETFTASNIPYGHLNIVECPQCGRHLFSYYDGDMVERPDRFQIAEDLNYCSKCGILLDLDKWKHTRDKYVFDNEDVKWED